jgi:hypothetical protein
LRHHQITHYQSTKSEFAMTTVANSTPSAPQPPRKKRRWLRRLLWTCAVLFVLLVLLVLLAPTLICTGPGRSLALSFANDAIQGRVEVADLSLGWFSGTSVKGIKLSDPQGRSVVEVAGIDAPSITLLGLVRGNLDLGKITIAHVNATLIQNADGSTNLQQAIAMRHPSPAQPAAPAAAPAKPMDLSALKLALALQDIKASYTQPQQAPIDVSLEAATQLTGLHLIQLDDLHIELGQGPRRGSLQGKAVIRGLLDDAGKPHLDKFNVDATVTATSLPLDLVDNLAHQQGKLVALLGPDLNVNFTAKGGMADATAGLEVASLQLHVQTALTLHNGVLTLKPGSDLRFTLTPQAFTALTAVSGKPAAYTLLKPVDLTVQFTRVSAGLPGASGAAFDPRGADLDLALTISDLSLDGGPDLGLASLTGTKGAVTFAGADHSKLNVTLNASAALTRPNTAPAPAGQVSVNATLTDLFAADGQLNLAGLTAQTHATIANWPVAVLDQLLHQKGLLFATIGPTLSTDLTATMRPGAEGKPAAGDVSLTIQSQNISGTLSAAVSSEGIQTTNAPAAPQTLTFHLPKELLPLLIAQYAPGSAALQTLALTQPADLKASLTPSPASPCASISRPWRACTLSSPWTCPVPTRPAPSSSTASPSRAPSASTASSSPSATTAPNKPSPPPSTPAPSCPQWRPPHPPRPGLSPRNPGIPLLPSPPSTSPWA